MNSQYEINLRHSGALDAADRAFRLKAAVKDIAAQNGLHATFMGKPFNDQGGSGTHLHLSLNRDGANAFADPAGEQGVSAELGQFTAGLIEHAPALMAFLNPTINAYRRIQPGLAGADPRQLGLGQPRQLRADPARARRRAPASSCASATAPPTRTSAIAAVLLAGADGMRRELAPPPPLSGDAYRADRKTDRRAAADLARARAGRARGRQGPARRPRRGDRRDLPGDEGLRARTPPRLGLRLGDRRVPPPPLGAQPMPVTSEFIDLSDHDNFVDAVPHEAFAQLRRRGSRPLEPRSPTAAVASGR